MALSSVLSTWAASAAGPGTSSVDTSASSGLPVWVQLVIALVGSGVSISVPLGIALINRSGKSKEVEPDHTVMVPKTEYDALTNRIATMDAQAHQLEMERDNDIRELKLELRQMQMQRDDYWQRYVNAKGTS